MRSFAFALALLALVNLIDDTTVQCTKGKCTKAVHVTCAMHTDSGFFLDATVPGEEGHTAVSLLDQARAEMDPMSPKKSKVAIPQRTSPLVASAALPAPVPVEDDEAIKLTVLCRTHNPVRSFSLTLFSTLADLALVVNRTSSSKKPLARPRSSRSASKASSLSLVCAFALLEVSSRSLSLRTCRRRSLSLCSTTMGEFDFSSALVPFR